MNAEEIRGFRVKNSLSQLAFARLLGVTPRTVSWWEAGAEDRHPPPYLDMALIELQRRLDKDARWVARHPTATRLDYAGPVRIRVGRRSKVCEAN
jgi:transcriptional regulator with XRE-family HTH domain